MLLMLVTPVSLLPMVVLFVLVAVAVFAFAYAFDQKTAGKALSKRLAAVSQAEGRGATEELALLREEIVSEIPAFNRILARYPVVLRLQRLLAQAEVKVLPGKFLLICAFTGALAGTVAYVWQGYFFLSLIAGAIGAVAPFVYVLTLRRRRFNKFEELFPEAIDLLGRAVRAGHAFTTALELIADELSEPVAGEFRTVFEEQKFGLPVREALLNFAERMPLVDVKFFVTAVMLQRETGGNLAEILDNLSYVIRERFKIQRQVRVHTAQGRLTMALLMAMPPTVVAILFVFSPEFVAPLFHDPIGHALLVASIALQTTGYFVIRKIIKIQV